MDRRNFLTKFGIGLGGLSLSNITSAKEKKETYRFDEVFYRPHEGNQNLIYVRDNSILADKIYETGKVNKNLESEYQVGIYFPVRELFIELKGEYNEQDFQHIIFYLKNKSQLCFKFIAFQNQKVGRSPMRFILNKEGYMQAEFLYENL